MDSIITLEKRCNFICHFKSEELRQSQGGTTPHFQCTFDPENDGMSPSGDFIFFNNKKDKYGECSQIHGWQPIDNIVIDEILEEFEEEVKIAVNE